MLTTVSTTRNIKKNRACGACLPILKIYNVFNSNQDLKTVCSASLHATCNENCLQKIACSALFHNAYHVKCATYQKNVLFVILDEM